MLRRLHFELMTIDDAILRRRHEKLAMLGAKWSARKDQMPRESVGDSGGDPFDLLTWMLHSV